MGRGEGRGQRQSWFSEPRSQWSKKWCLALQQVAAGAPRGVLRALEQQTRLAGPRGPSQPPGPTPPPHTGLQGHAVLRALKNVFILVSLKVVRQKSI